jgi:hypothetical protein
MKCKYFRLLNRYADGEISTDDKTLLESHLLDCPVCAQELKVLKALKENTVRKDIQTNPEFFWQQLKGRIAQEGRDKAQEIEVGFGNWAKRLIPIPVVIGIIAIVILNAIPDNLNPVDEYLFGNGNGSVVDLVEESGNQSVIGM